MPFKWLKNVYLNNAPECLNYPSHHVTEIKSNWLIMKPLLMVIVAHNNGHKERKIFLSKKISKYLKLSSKFWFSLLMVLWRTEDFWLGYILFQKNIFVRKKPNLKKRLINIQGVDLQLRLLNKKCSCILISLLKCVCKRNVYRNGLKIEKIHYTY